MPHALLNNVALLAGGDGFDPFDPNGAGNLIWTLLIFLLALPFMWKMVFGPISAALLERDSKANEAVNAAQAASEQAERSQRGGRGRPRQRQRRGQEDRRRGHLPRRDPRAGHRRERQEGGRGDDRQGQGTSIGERDKAVATIRGEVVDLSLKAATEVLGRKVDGRTTSASPSPSSTPPEPAVILDPVTTRWAEALYEIAKKADAVDAIQKDTERLSMEVAPRRRSPRLSVRQRRLPGRSRGEDGAPDG